MKYMLNDEKITKARAEELIDDLAMFPYDAEDYSISVMDRKQKYSDILLKNRELRLAESLILKVTNL